ncbi:hypothetical protein D1872_289230 [compost metagenome]
MTILPSILYRNWVSNTDFCRQGNLHLAFLILDGDRIRRRHRIMKHHDRPTRHRNTITTYDVQSVCARLPLIHNNMPAFRIFRQEHGLLTIRPVIDDHNISPRIPTSVAVQPIGHGMIALTQRLQMLLHQLS